MFEKVGSEAGDAASWRDFLEKLITLARENGCAGIKQLQAYRRDLDFEKPEDSVVRFNGELNHDEQRIFQNWLVNECSRLADDLGWPHQVHVGTHNLPESNPLPLQKLARRYRKQKIVQIHCWPFQREAGYLAKLHPNVYIDTCWQAVLNPAYLREALDSWLYRIAANVSKLYWRRHKHKEIVGIEIVDLADSAEDGHDRVGRYEQLDELRTAVARLPFKLKETIVLHYMQQLTIAKAAQALGIKEGTFKSRLNRALRTLRKDVT